MSHQFSLFQSNKLWINFLLKSTLSFSLSPNYCKSILNHIDPSTKEMMTQNLQDKHTLKDKENVLNSYNSMIKT